MKIAGIIAEYNPFHNGHAYHIEEVRKKTGADFCIIIMSGNFVQRGGPAIADKYIRAEMALKGGTDLVIELPVVAATASAETFAKAGVSILNATGVVTHLGFGCETEDFHLLNTLAELFVEEPADYQQILSSCLKEGLSYPAARAKSAAEYLSETVFREVPVTDSRINKESISPTSIRESSTAKYNKESDVKYNKECTEKYSRDSIESILNNPNNILAIEYLKALKQLDSNILPCPILRNGNDYHDESLTGRISSATAIRHQLHQLSLCQDKMLSDSYKDFLYNYIPEASADIMWKSLQVCPAIYDEHFSSLLHYKLQQERGNYASFYDCSQELANRILSQLESYTGFEQFTDTLKTKNQTYTGISRALTHILLGIRKTHFEMLQSVDYAPYIRVLGFKKEASSLLTLLKESHIPVITKLAEAETEISKNTDPISAARSELLRLDISAGHIYDIARTTLTGEPVKSEYRKSLIYV